MSITSSQAAALAGLAFQAAAVALVAAFVAVASAGHPSVGPSIPDRPE